MKSIIGVVSVVVGVSFAVLAEAAEKPGTSEAELAAIQTQLKPLRKKAYREADVVAARKKLDAEYRAYWETVRAAMERLDPSKKALIEKEIAARKSRPAIGPKNRAKEKKAVAPGKPAGEG